MLVFELGLERRKEGREGGRKRKKRVGGSRGGRENQFYTTDSDSFNS